MNNSSKKIMLLLFAAGLFLAGCMPLIQAAADGDIKEMERLITAGENVNATNLDNNYFTPMRMAAYNGKTEAVELLISKGVNVNARDFYDRIPLHWAADGGNKETVELLISKGADVNARDKEGHTPLDIAKARGHTSIVSLLQNNREIVNLTAVTEPSSPAAEEAFREIARNYRAATVRPALPEEARKFWVQAEYAVNKMDFDGAVERYKEALEVAPWWPEGHFNRAMILGELSRYRDAIREMKKYLTLVPEASNARAAQDKIYQWEGELK
jgi:tetratricopeptide (TPR) repeat protein